MIESPSIDQNEIAYYERLADNRNWLSWVVAIIGAEYVFRMSPRGTHQWSKFRKPKEIEKLLKKNGVKVFTRSGVRVNPLRRSLHLTRFLGVNYMLLAEKP